uniref:Uncharacterized protein n=1 Tax=Micrurus paraensis TaxID=1970185 RepID=A0A2D4KVV3_9SAUR
MTMKRKRDVDAQHASLLSGVLLLTRRGILLLGVHGRASHRRDANRGCRPVSYGQFHPPAKARVLRVGESRGGDVSRKLSKRGGSLLAVAGASEAERWVREEANGASAHRPPTRAPNAPVGQQRDPTSGTPRLGARSESATISRMLLKVSRQASSWSPPPRARARRENARRRLVQKGVQGGRANGSPSPRGARLQIAPLSSAGAGQGRCNPP